MAVPNRLIRKMNEALGAEASDDMVDWMNRIESSLAELRSTTVARFDALVRWMLGFWAASLVTIVASLYALSRVIR